MEMDELNNRLLADIGLQTSRGMPDAPASA